MLANLGIVWIEPSSAVAAAVQQKIFTVSEGEVYSHLPRKPHFRSQRYGTSDGGEDVRLTVVVDQAGNVESARAKAGRRELFREVEAWVKRVKFTPFLQNERGVRTRFEYHVSILPPEAWKKPRVPFPVIQNWKTFHARLERRTCHRSDICFWYLIEVAGDGAVTYDGTRATTIPGLHHDHIPQEAVIALLEEFKKADYFSLRNTYLLDVNHGEGAFTFIAFDGKQKSVDDFHGQSVGAPDALEVLEEAFDRIAGSRKWVWGNSETARSLEAERWNFQAKNEENDQLFANSFERGPKELNDFLLAQPKLSQQYLACMLGAAAANGDLMLFRSILKRGINPNDSACHIRGGVTALMRAMESGQSEIIRSLLTYHPDVNRKGVRGETALMTYLRGAWKSAYGRPPAAPTDLEPQTISSIVELFLKAGADVNARDDNAQTLLYYACDKPIQIWDKLVKAGGDVHVCDVYGRTLLMACHNTDILRKLLCLNPDLGAKDRNGKTALDLARAEKDWKKVALLQQAFRN